MGDFQQEVQLTAVCFWTALQTQTNNIVMIYRSLNIETQTNQERQIWFIFMLIEMNFPALSLTTRGMQ